MKNVKWKRLKYEQVKEYIDGVNGYKLLSLEYKNCYNQKLEIRCPNGHIFKMVFNNFKKGFRCNHPSCMNKRNSESNKLSINNVRKDIEIDGYKLLSDEYIGSTNGKLSIMCNKNHVFEMRHSAFKQGERCPICSLELKKNKYDDVKFLIESNGYKLLSEKYTRALDNIIIECNKGHVFKMRYNSFQQGQRCPECAKDMCRSKYEDYIVEYIGSIYNGKIIKNDRTLIKNPKTGKYLEIDIWIPDLRKAIEFNGDYWHNNQYVKYKDGIKYEWCKNNNVDLLVVMYSKWLKNNDFNLIRRFINGS